MRALSRLIVVMLVLLWPHVCGGQTLSPSSKGRIDRPSAQPDATVLEIIRDLSRLPPRAARMRERILEAARSGSLDKLLIVMQSNETLPVFSFGNEKDPVAFWKTLYPWPDGIWHFFVAGD